ncbi:actin-like protein ARP6 [Panus rudis PR-1116 ss-1]|nr:actin-like protein ARP6 [Panus rudis PR-1116 ss-1]
MRPVLVLDNGAHTIKMGISSGQTEPHGITRSARLIMNAVVRSTKGEKATYVGQEIRHCRDFSSLHFRLPFEKGFIVDWDAQKAIWDDLFTPKIIGTEPTSASLLITEPYFDLPNIQDVYDQFVFEEYEFHSYFRCTPASMIPYGQLYDRPNLPAPQCIIVVDSGFSFTHVVPLINGSIAWNAVKRLDVGGKLLTNHLKELVSFRHYDMMKETYIINDVKERCCYVSQNFSRELGICRENPTNNPIVQEYILPDYSIPRPGRVRKPDEPLDDSCQILYMNNERFSVPEVLFRPDDIGLEQSGVAATIAHSISILPEDLQGMFWSHIGLIGGSTKFPGFRERLLSELRMLAPVDCQVEIYQSSEPILDAYRGALAFAQRPEFQQSVVTRAEYQEMGSNACRRKFRDWKPIDEESMKTKPVGRG